MMVRQRSNDLYIHIYMCVCVCVYAHLLYLLSSRRAWQAAILARISAMCSSIAAHCPSTSWHRVSKEPTVGCVCVCVCVCACILILMWMFPVCKVSRWVNEDMVTPSLHPKVCPSKNPCVCVCVRVSSTKQLTQPILQLGISIIIPIQKGLVCLPEILKECLLIRTFIVIDRGERRLVGGCVCVCVCVEV